MNILLYAPEYRPNLSNMIRSAEFFGLKKIYIYDKNGLMTPPSNKAGKAEMQHMAKVWTAGAVDHIEIIKIEEIHPFFKNYEGRKVATVVDEKAAQLEDFRFLANDLIIMGPEKEGLPYSARALCDKKLFLPNKGFTDCLNVSTMLGIMLYAYQVQS